MAERRMFAKTIIDSDAFLDMPMSTQLLYFHLSMRADDEGFLNNPKKIQKFIGASDNDFDILKAKKFIICFDTGVIVIKHWKINNYIQKDRCKETIYQSEKSMLGIKPNKAYTLNFDNPGTKPLMEIPEMYPKSIQDVSSLDTECTQPVYRLDTICIHDQNGQKSENRMDTDENGMYTECIQNGYNSDTQVRLGQVNNNLINHISNGYSYVMLPESEIETETKNRNQTETKLDDITVIWEKVREKWNSLSDIGIDPVYQMTDKRKELLLELIDKYGFNSFDDAIERIRESDFLKGIKGASTWRIDFNWLISPEHYPAVLEGQYQDFSPFPQTKRQAKPRSYVPIEQHNEDIAELEKKLLDN